ncbi:MAG: hypothetical protein IJ408_02890 [Clostridia bacterium]|nr:hypothetical protein [Clostridia bacterium]
MEPDKPDLPATKPETSQNTDDTKSVDWDGHLLPVRQMLLDEQKAFAVAYLGYYDKYSLEDTTKANKRFAANFEFLSEIPSERIIGSGGELYLVVGNAETDVAVNLLAEDGSTTEVLFKGDLSEPIMVFANGGTFSPDTQIVTIDTSFAPCLDYNGRLAKSDAVYDFSNYEDAVEQLYTVAKENLYRSPTREMLVNTSWNGECYVNSEITKTYSLDFFEDKVKIQWNDGIDAEDHEFEAKWSLSEKDEVCILNINLDNLDGERTYIPLMPETDDMLYILSDYVNGDVHRDYEKLNIMLAKTVG